MQKDQKKGLELIGNDDCATCHGIRRSNGPSIGPSYEEIAIKYRRESFRSTVNLLATRIISGSSGVWGPVPMTRHPSISREDARTMVRYILSVKK